MYMCIHMHSHMCMWWGGVGGGGAELKQAQTPPPRLHPSDKSIRRASADACRRASTLGVVGLLRRTRIAMQTKNPK